MSSLINLVIQARREAYNALNFLFIRIEKYIHSFFYRKRLSRQHERRKEREKIYYMHNFTYKWETKQQLQVNSWQKIYQTLK